MEGEEYSDNLKLNLFTQAPSKSFIHKEQSEEELYEDDLFCPPEGHCSATVTDGSDFSIFSFGGFYPESNLKSDNANAIIKASFTMNREGLIYQTPSENQRSIIVYNPPRFWVKTQLKNA